MDKVKVLSNIGRHVTKDGLHAALDYIKNNHDMTLNPITRDCFIMDVGVNLVTGEGKLIKRISKWVKLNYGIKLSKKDINTIGNFINANTPELSGDISIDTRYNVDWNPGYYGDGGSCLMTEGKEYYHMRPVLEDAGCPALVYEIDGRRGRCLMIPLDVLQEHSDLSEDIENKDNLTGFIIYNAYGPLRLSELAGVIAKEIELISSEIFLDIAHMYINNSLGYMLLSDKIDIPSWVNVDLPGAHDGDDGFMWCERCECSYHPDEMNMGYCTDCYNEIYQQCDNCLHHVYRDNIYFHAQYDLYICDDCFHDTFAPCYKCDDTFRIDYDIKYYQVAGEYICESCEDDVFIPCHSCKDIKYTSDLVQLDRSYKDDNYYCRSCIELIKVPDPDCQYKYPLAQACNHNKDRLCYGCQ